MTHARARDDEAQRDRQPKHPLFSLPNVTLPPNSAGSTRDNWAKAYRNGFDNIQRVKAGRALFWVLPEPSS